MKKLLKKLALCSAIVSAGAAADYRVELEGGVEHSELSYRGGFADTVYRDGYDVWNLEGTYYFQPVATQDVPLSDAGFLSKSSLVKLGFAKRNSAEVEDTTVGVEGIWVFSNNFFAGLSYLDDKSEEPEDSFQQTGPGVIVGSYIGDTSAVQLHYQKFEHDYDEPDFGESFDESDREAYTLSYKNVVMANNRAHTDIELELFRNNEVVSLDSRLGWYCGFNFKYGLAVTVLNDESGDGQNAYGAWAEYFIGNSFAVAAEYNSATIKAEDIGDDFRVDNDTVELTAKYRF